MLGLRRVGKKGLDAYPKLMDFCVFGERYTEYNNQ